VLQHVTWKEVFDTDLNLNKEEVLICIQWWRLITDNQTGTGDSSAEIMDGPVARHIVVSVVVLAPDFVSK